MQALAFRLKEVDQLNLSAQMMSNHIKQLEAAEMFLSCGRS
jgi:hypothetical protein